MRNEPCGDTLRCAVTSQLLVHNACTFGRLLRGCRRQAAAGNRATGCWPSSTAIFTDRYEPVV